MIIGATLVIGTVWRNMKAVVGSAVLIIVIYLAVGMYQNVVILQDPIYFIRYVTDLRAVADAAVNVPVNQDTTFGNPATVVFGLINTIIVAALALLYLLLAPGRVRSSRGATSPERLAFLLFIGTAAPMIALFAFGGPSFVAGRFKDQVGIWILLTIMPFLLAYLPSRNRRRILVGVLSLTVVTSISGFVVANGVQPSPYLSPTELATSEFVWQHVSPREYIFTDWIRGTSLMYGHAYLYGPDPYTMPPGLFTNVTQQMYYSDNPESLDGLVTSALQTHSYLLFFSQGMVTKGPVGPDHNYKPATPDLLGRFSRTPGFDVIYSSGDAILVRPST
jgi:hypothetical protein